MAQEDLSNDDRTWSFAPDSQQGSEIATVPEEIDHDELESPIPRLSQQSTVDHV